MCVRPWLTQKGAKTLRAELILCRPLILYTVYLKYVLPSLSLPSSLALITRIQNGKALNSRVILSQGVCSWLRITRLRDIQA